MVRTIEGLRALSVATLVLLAGSAESAWISGNGHMPAETDTAAFFKEQPNDIVCKRFGVRPCAVKRAVWRVTAPGMRDLSVNGRRITATALPPWTPYAKRILCECFDVTGAIESGRENELRVELGNGWYNPLPLKLWYGCDMRAALTTGKPCVDATLEIEYADGVKESVATDATWQAYAGQVVRNSIYLGVEEDRRHKVQADGAAQVVAGPVGRVEPAGDFPKVIVYDRWTAKDVRAVTNGTWIVDMGVNFAGTYRATLRGVAAGRRVVFRSGERLHPNGRVNTLTAVAGQIKDPVRGPLFDVAEQRDAVVGGGEPTCVFEPRFTFHVFRYIEVSGLDAAPKPEDFEALAWSADMRERAAFTCSNERLNKLHEVCRRTFRSNLQSVQSDCPGREKFGYGGDMACTAEAFWCNYDMHAFYRKAIRDLIDEAADDGILTETAPYVGLGDSAVFPPNAANGRKYAPMGWSVGLPVLLDGLVRHAGDLDIVREAYPTLTRYLRLVRERYPDNKIPMCLGDWIPPYPALKADRTMSALAHWHQYVALTARFAALLGKDADAAEYRRLAAEIALRFNERHVKDGVVCKGTQGDQLFALQLGLLPPSVEPSAYGRLVQDIRSRGSLTTGIFATKYLLHYLSTHGDAALAGEVVTHRGFPGWLDMIDRGATTLWEHWDEKACLNVYSNCHPMFGSVDEWLVRHVLGISVCDDAIGCDKVRLEPHAVAGVTSASGWLDTPKGRITVAWKLERGKIYMTTTVPPGIVVVKD